jgi:hypothetical protein
VAFAVTDIAYIPVKCMPLTATPITSAAMTSCTPRLTVIVNQSATVEATTAMMMEAITSLES